MSQDLTRKGVTVFVPDRSFRGYTLFCHTYDPPNVAVGEVAHIYLIDMEGSVVHEWTAETAVQLLELLSRATSTTQPGTDQL